MTTIATTPDTTSATSESAAREPVWCAAFGRATTCAQRLEPYGQSAFLLAMRLLYGWFFIRIGSGKLMHLDRTAVFFDSLSLPAPGFMAGMVGTTELVGGTLLLLGLGTRYAAAILTSVMAVAYLTAHASEAFSSLDAFTAQEPFPFLVATLLALAFGPGRISIDQIHTPAKELAGPDEDPGATGGEGGDIALSEEARARIHQALLRAEQKRGSPLSQESGPCLASPAGEASRDHPPDFTEPGKNGDDHGQ